MTATVDGVLTEVYESKTEKGKLEVTARGVTRLYDNDVKKRMTEEEVTAALAAKNITIPVKLGSDLNASRISGAVGVIQTGKGNFMAYFVQENGYIRNMGVFGDQLEANTRAYITALRLDIASRCKAA